MRFRLPFFGLVKHFFQIITSTYLQEPSVPLHASYHASTLRVAWAESLFYGTKLRYSLHQCWQTFFHCLAIHCKKTLMRSPKNTQVFWSLDIFATANTSVFLQREWRERLWIINLTLITIIALRRHLVSCLLLMISLTQVRHPLLLYIYWAVRDTPTVKWNEHLSWWHS